MITAEKCRKKHGCLTQQTLEYLKQAGYKSNCHDSLRECQAEDMITTMMTQYRCDSIPHTELRCSHRALEQVGVEIVTAKAFTEAL
jgi:hypothetical protein